VAAESLGVALHGSGGDAELSADLTKAGSSDQPMKDPLEEIRVAEPVGGREGL